MPQKSHKLVFLLDNFVQRYISDLIIKLHKRYCRFYADAEKMAEKFLTTQAEPQFPSC